MFLPVSIQEMKKLGWSKADIILVTGDSYIDTPFSGIAVIGKFLLSKGYKVAVIAQPDTASDIDIKRLGEPSLFWGVSGGCVDSMVANYTATGKKRKSDDYTPGGINNKRPDRAVINYTNLIKRYFKKTVPIVIGGIEASLRRIAHYDFWSNKVRRSVLLDSKADYLIYGMGEPAILELAEKIKSGSNTKNIYGICYISNTNKPEFIQLPSFEASQSDKNQFSKMFGLFYENNDPLTAQGMVQKHGDRYLIHNPPQPHMTQKEIDYIYDLDFERSQHPYYQKKGDVKALDTIRFSLTTHRGCYGECNFCAIAVHQGRSIISRSMNSILSEAEKIAGLKNFKGYITDAGGPTANMYGFDCHKKLQKGACKDKRCMFPEICNGLKPDHSILINLLERLRSINGVKKVFASSGIRYDLIDHDKKSGDKYLKQIVENHVSGQLKIAPEHSESSVLKIMGKPDIEKLASFKQKFDKLSNKISKKQFLTYYIMAAHPGCSINHMKALKKYTSEVLKTNPEQVQIFTPTPSTYSTLMYYTEKNPFSGKKIGVEKSLKRKEMQKNIITDRFRRKHKNENKYRLKKSK